MAVPKQKTSKAKTNSRYANWKAEAPAMSECPNCRAPKRNHFACPSCGFYKGEKKVAAKTDKADKKAAK